MMVTKIHTLSTKMAENSP